MHSTICTRLLAAVVLVAGVTWGTAAAEARDGKAIAQKNACFACHGIGASEPKKMGPNYGVVAAKYAKDGKAIAKLATKIRKGGAGSFGSIPMPGYPQISEADAKAIAQWVMQQK